MARRLFPSTRAARGGRSRQVGTLALTAALTAALAGLVVPATASASVTAAW